MTVFQEGGLKLELEQAQGAVRLAWSGRSTAREPSRFIVPVLAKAVELCEETRAPLVLDFCRIEFMNSSTITPVIRTLEQARKASRSIRVLYQKNVKWQQLSFSALQVFETPDRRIQVCGVV
jgi:hypothetical protein